MIPDIAVIISTYAVARLLCEYVIAGDLFKDLRTWVGIIAIVIIGFFMFSVVGAANDLGGLNI